MHRCRPEANRRPAVKFRNAAVTSSVSFPIERNSPMRAIRRAGEFLSAPSATVIGFSFPNAIDTFSTTHCMRRKGLSDDRQCATAPGNCLGSMCRAQLRCRHFRLSSCTRQAQGGACRGRRRVEGLCKVCAKQRLERGLLAGIRDTSSRPEQIRGSGSQRSKRLFLGLA
jgi:hypothetical protein